MRLDEGLDDQKLALDITPLIDIIFLLVLFFAVSTSFISGEDLRALKTDLVTFDEERKELTSTVATKSKEIDQVNTAFAGLQTDYTRMVAKKTQELQTLAARIEETDGKAAKLEFMVAALRNQKVDLVARITDRSGENKSLESQLKKAYADFQNLNAELTAAKSDSEQRAEQERLLRALLLEREEKHRTLDNEHSTLAQKNSDLAAKMQATVVEVQAVRTEAEQAAAQELLLQKLLAEKAGELDSMQVGIDAAAARLADDLANTKTQASAQAAAAESQTRGMQTQILRLQSELNKFRQIANLDRGQIERILQAQEQLEAGLQDYLKDEQLALKRDQQRLTLQLSDTILFASGKATIKREGLEVLRSLGKILKERIGQLEIQIGGHTDNVPIRGRSGPLADNWGLSAARAVTVVRFFQEEVGINPTNMSAVGYSEHRPVGANDTPQGRSQNRRIEIVLLPR